MTISICVLGLGLMGRPIAKKLLEAGLDVTGWNRSALLPELTHNIPLGQSLAEAAQADICLLMLLGSDAVDAVLEQLEPHLFAGQLVLDMSSSDPARSVVNARRLAEKGIGWVDAPVSGGPEGAETGTLAIMAGGLETDFGRVQPILEILGGNVVHVGGPGAGHTVKVINQIIVGVTLEAVAEALTLAEKLGINPQLVQQALNGGFADSKILQIHGARMMKRDYRPGGKLRTQYRDLKLGQNLAAEIGVTLPFLNHAVDLYQILMDQNNGDLDHSAIHKLLWSE